MAELHIERKEHSVWPWVIAALVLLALVAWFLLGRGPDARQTAVADSAAAGVMADTGSMAAATMAGADTMGAMPAPVREFMSYVDERRARAAADQSHDYTADGIRRLSAALAATAAQHTATSGEVQPQLDTLRARADALQRDPGSSAHAGYARDAFSTAAAVMRTLQERVHPALGDAVSEVEQAAMGVSADRLLLDQTAEVQRFFDAAATAIQRMAAGSTA